MLILEEKKKKKIMTLNKNNKPDKSEDKTENFIRNTKTKYYMTFYQTYENYQ